jgi:hypothetical protein
MKTGHLKKKFILMCTAIYFILMTVLFTRSLSRQIMTHNVGGYGDNLYFIWQIEWIKRAVFDLNVMPLTSNLLNYPYGYSLLTTEIAPLQILFALPFALIGEPVLGYNISIMSTFFLAGLTMFLWVYAMTESWQASLISGTAFAFLPYHIAHFLIGHLNLAGIQWFPLYFWGFTAILTGEHFSWKHVLLLSVGISAIALTSQYYIYMTFIISVIILIGYFCFFAREKFLSKEIWKQFVLAGAISAPFLIIGIGPYLYFHSGRGSKRAMEDTLIFSASITDFLLPFTKQILLGKWVWRKFPRDLWNEATLYLGLPATILSIIGWMRREALGKKRIFQIFLIGGITAGVLAFGTNLTWMEEPVWINLPEWFSELADKEQSLIYLPGYLLFKYIPFYSIMRVWMRYGIFVMVFNCAAAGIGAHWILSRVKLRWKNLLGFVILSFVILDFFNTPFSTTEIEPREVDLWLAEQPYGGLVQLPFEQSLIEENFYYTLYHHKPLMGAVRAFPSDRFLYMGSALNNFPDPKSVEALRGEQITYIVVDENEIPVTDEILINAADLGLKHEGSFTDQSVFTINY